jgi:hypothetical protein
LAPRFSPGDFTEDFRAKQTLDHAQAATFIRLVDSSISLSYSYKCIFYTQDATFRYDCVLARTEDAPLPRQHPSLLACRHRTFFPVRTIEKAFVDRNLPLFTAYVSRSFDRTKAIIRLLSSGAVGDRVETITYALRGSDLARGLDWSHRIPWRLDAEKSGGGLIMDVGCHVLDRIDYLCGPILNVRGAGTIGNESAKKQEVEDSVELQGVIGPSSWAVIPSEGATVECSWDFSASDSMDELVISGSG